MVLDDLRTLQEIAVEARRRMSPQAWDYLSGGAESETTLRRNRLALDTIAFRPRVLNDVAEVDATTTLLGIPMRIPVFLAPIGSLHLMNPGAAVPVVKAAETFGSIPFISTVSSPGLDESAKIGPGPKVFQLYVRGDRGWVDDVLDRVVKAGYKALCVTVDVAWYGRRERDLINRFNRREFVARANIGNVRQEQEFKHQAEITWDFIARCRDRTKLPIIVKGIATAEDAQLAVDRGVDVVYVSNHGGRQLDHGMGAMDILPEVVAAVGRRAEILIDGGFCRGTDVVKALALGARAVGIGKLQGWALAAGGQEGLERAFELLETEIRMTLALLGCASLEDLSPRHVRPAAPVGPAHPMGAYPHFLQLFDR
jgi:isopentenyl diphosphate isomerase/L-lactate dehydrogenase-like FMN-dependent dehydrogenase